MSITKYANSPILAVADSAKSFRKLANNSDFEFDARDGYLYITVRAISSRCNENHDGFIPMELEAHWETFRGCPHFIEHDNSNWRKARGVVVDAAFHKQEASADLLKSQRESFDSKFKYDPVIWTPEEHIEHYALIDDKLAVNFNRDDWVELLVEVDAESYPKYATALLENKISTFSMGTDVERSYCSACGNLAKTPAEYCSHVMNQKGQWIQKAGNTPKIYVYEDNRDLSFFEISAVKNPADTSATLLELSSGLQSTACNLEILGVTLKVLGEELLDNDRADKALVYELLAEAHRPVVNQEHVASLLDSIAKRL